MTMLKPRKRFGQHFLCDAMVIEKIIHALQPHKADHLLEIGPGQGALTIPLLRRHLKLDVIEIDNDLVAELKLRSHDNPNLIIHHQDALTFDFSVIPIEKLPMRIVGNLPYNISTPLLFHLLAHAVYIQDMLFMLQKEVAERLAAPPHSATYGRLSIMMQYHCEIELLFNVAPNAFFPPPKVQSSILRLVPHSAYPCKAGNYTFFSELVKTAFNQRRKTLRNSLKSLVSDAVWDRVAISPNLRAQDLSVADFVNLSNAMQE